MSVYVCVCHSSLSFQNIEASRVNKYLPPANKEIKSEICYSFLLKIISQTDLHKSHFTPKFRERMKISGMICLLGDEIYFGSGGEFLGDSLRVVEVRYC